MELTFNAHSFIYDWSRDASKQPAGYFPVWVERVGEVCLVRQAGMAELSAGDAIVSIAGMSVHGWYEEQAQYVSAATPGNRDAQVSQRLLTLEAPLDIGVISYGATSTTNLTVMPQPAQTLGTLTFQRSSRHSGWLSDLGAPSVYLIQMEGTMTNPDELLASAEEARMASAVIVDMRGYPWDFNRQYSDDDLTAQFHAYAIIQGPGRSALFSTPIWTGPDRLDIAVDQYPTPADPEMIQAPMALLVGPETQSSAEDFSIYFLDARPNAIVVGRQSSGTNGNITGLNVLGGFGFTFTGLEVRFPDGRRFHGVGIEPTVPLVTSADDLHSGVDHDVLEALSALGSTH